MAEEIPVHFSCSQEELYGVLHLPSQPGPKGVLIIVGGPQYRVGSHRQFVLLTRALADHGIAGMRFDQRGVGDSEGDSRGFEDINADVRAAIDTLIAHVPTLKEVVIWGLCDAASAALFYAPTDPRVTGLVLLNPWVRSEGGIARTYLRHYYFTRLLDANFWRKIFRGEMNFVVTLRSFLDNIVVGLEWKKGAQKEANPPVATAVTKNGSSNQARAPEPFPERMRDGLAKFRGRALFILSGDDLTAGEFKDLIATSRGWKKLLREPRVQRRDFAEANHTFSRRAWRDQVASWTKEWIGSW